MTRLTSPTCPCDQDAPCICLITFGITTVCSGYFFDLKKKRQQVQNSHPVDKTFKVYNAPAPAIQYQLLKGFSLIWRDMECTVHPRGSGLLVTVGWSWAEASAAGVTAGLAAGAVGSRGARAGVGWEPLAAETHAQQVLNIQNSTCRTHNHT